MWDRFFYLHLTHNRFFYLSLLTGDIESVYMFEVDTDQTGAAPNIIFTEINKSNTDTNVGQIFLHMYIEDSFTFPYLQVTQRVCMCLR